MNSPMLARVLYRFLALSFASVAVASYGQTSSKNKSYTPEQLEFFETKIRPVLVSKCYECHSEERGKNKGEFTLDTRDGIRIGGDRGPAIVPGKPEEGTLINAIRQVGRLNMPPDSRGGMLPENVIADFEKWVKDGAADPRDSAKIVNAEQSKPEKPVDWDKERQFWAFEKAQRIAPPQVADEKWPKSDVDRFVLAKLEEKGLKPVSDADKRTLARRAYYDLIGLPPTSAEVDAFVNDRSPGAYEKLVDQLIASPRFGEQWGRHWLDVARYGESSGLDRNLNYPYAWRYRDYVIDSFNQDKPYNRFVTEQLAGDQLPFNSQPERDENLIATGFLAIGPKGLNETRIKYSKWQVVGDQVDATTRGFLGLTVSCAQCHDHKFDPIPQRDFHALAGIFSSTETLYGTVGGRGNRRPTSLLSLNGAPTLAVLSTGEPTPNMFVNTNANFNASLRTNNPARGTNGFGGRRFARNLSTNVIERIPATNRYAMGVRDYDEPQDSPLYSRGDLSKPRDPVPRGFLRIVAMSNPPPIPTNSSGRLQLAQWITDPENPLTARVAVNRVWQHLFGEGIVATPDNFGHLGSRPTHPQLLDYLAVQFVTEQNWSLKKLVRSLVLTHAYQLSTEVDAKALEIDPADTLVWRAAPRRLKAEQLRDSILTASGRIDLEPPRFAVTAQFGDGYYGVNIWETDLPQHYYKRSVYLPVPRDLVPDSLALFDLPNPNLVGAHREETTSPSQALFLMNNALVQDEALHIARQLLENKGLSERERIGKAYLAALQRQPTEEELTRARQFIQEEANLLESDRPKVVIQLATDSEPETQPSTASTEVVVSVKSIEAPIFQVAAALPPVSETFANNPAADLASPVATIASTSKAVAAESGTARAVAGQATIAQTPLTNPSAAAGSPGPAATPAPTLAGVTDTGGGLGGGAGLRRGPRRYNGPGSASDVVVAKLAPGVARPKVFREVLPEKPATPQEGALALFTQALFASAEFRFLQ